jgi:MFS transporter, DHA1 family, multidrug resistance protein
VRRLTPFVFLCLMGGLAIFSSTMAKNPALPLYIRSMGVPDATVGLIAAASTIVGILVSLPAGILSDLIGRRRVILASMVVFATAPFLYLLIHSPWQLVLVRVYHGLATAILGPVAMAAVADTFDARRGERLAWYSSATMIGRFLAPSIGGLLIFGDNFHWVYLADGVAGVLALLAALRLPHAPAGTVAAKPVRLSEAWASTRADLGVLARNGSLFATSLMEACQYFAFGLVEVYLPIYLHEQLGMAAWQIGPLFTAQVLVTTFSKPLTGRLSDRMGRVPFIALGLILDAVVMALMPLTRFYPLLMLLTATFGLALAMVTASTSAYVADLSRRTSHGAALGVLSSIMDVGHSAGPIVGGLLVATQGYGATFAITGAAIAAIAIAYWWRFAASAPKASASGA